MSARDDIAAYFTSDTLVAQLLGAYRAEIERESFYAAADEVDVDDDCGCGGCGSCVLQAAAGRLREKAGQPVTPLIVSRFDVAIEPAPEEEPVLTIGAVAETGRPVALLLDEETRRKVAGWLAPTEAGEKSSREVDATPQPYREVWDASLPPGGRVCSICGQPVESEPCPEHAPDFFQVDHTYRNSRWSFRVDAVTTHPDTGARAALGWWKFARGEWTPFTAGEAHWRDGWRDITEPAHANETPACATDDTPGEGT